MLKIIFFPSSAFFSSSKYSISIKRMDLKYMNAHFEY